VIFKAAAARRPCNGAVRNGPNWLGAARTAVPGNPYSIGRFSSGQVRPGPPYDSSNPAGLFQKPYLVSSFHMPRLDGYHLVTVPYGFVFESGGCSGDRRAPASSRRPSASYFFTKGDEATPSGVRPLIVENGVRWPFL
jgi:hypothetical protein